MKLELKHLAPYLSYQLICHAMGENTEESEYTDNVVPTDFVLHGLVNNKASIINEYGDKKLIDFDELFIILRPISDLTKEELDEFTVCFRMYHNKSNFDYKLMIYSDIELCFKKHIDIFGLIEKGLAVDKNTI